LVVGALLLVNVVVGRLKERLIDLEEARSSEQKAECLAKPS
jgi:hypothetical protein